MIRPTFMCILAAFSLLLPVSIPRSSNKGAAARISTQSIPTKAPKALKVVGVQIQDVDGRPVRLRGVNTAAMEWSSDGEGHIFQTVQTAVRDWRVNHIRLPLAQDRWFGKTPEQKDGGQAYRDLVKKVVEYCSLEGCYVILDLHWSDANEWGKSIGQHKMPDQNSVTFWKDIAPIYKNHPAVIFDLYNEPFRVDWDVWRNGGRITEKDEKTGKETTYEAVGMQTLLDAVRSTGAKNVVVVGGLDWSYDLSGVLKEGKLKDPEGEGVIYANHAYPFKGDSVEKWISKMETAAKTLPIIISEFGSDPKGGEGLDGEQWVKKVLTALESHGWSWTAWDLHPYASPCLVANWNYEPTPHFGKWIKQALAGQFIGAAKPAGLFETEGDVGTVLHPGSSSYNSEDKTYKVSGSGDNMWFAKDAFHFVWKRTSGDASLSADLSFPERGVEPHRKACLMIRQSLDPDSAYVDAAVHGDGLVSLQFRETKGGLTHEVQANASQPKRVGIEKQGKYTLLYLAKGDEEPSFSGASAAVAFEEPFYVGIGVCSHNANVSETALFKNIAYTSQAQNSHGTPIVHSTLETLSIASTDRRVVFTTPTRIEAPNWLRDGRLLFNESGKIKSVSSKGGAVETLNTGFAARCNNDHGPSPDEKLLAISDQSQGDRRSRVYIVPIEGGPPKRITNNAPSYWHGWSPDGKTLAYCGERDGEFDVYTIPVEGGQETRLTTAKGLDDGPEYAPDGKSIYFNSDRTGLMQIWRMNPDGSDQKQVTSDELNNWFPHPSPDGKSIAFLSYGADVKGHPEGKDVVIRLLSIGTGKIDVLAKFFGGQGTINVPSWSPDSKKIAFVTYHTLMDKSHSRSE